MVQIRFIDLFAGVGGFRYGLERCNGLKPTNEESQPTQPEVQLGGKRTPLEEERSVLPTDNGRFGAIHSRLDQKTRLGDEGHQPVISQLNGGEQGECTNASNEKTQFTCVFSNEWDKYANSVYRKHYGECDSRDIRTIPESELPDFDLLCGGFPCQAFSIAGKRKGFEDTRGTLFFEIARILKHKRPRYLLLENVKGLLNHDSGKTFQTILGVLADLGYGVEWQVLNSKNFGVPQNRERVFIIGHLGGIGSRQVFPVGGNDQKTNPEIKYIGGIVSERDLWLKDGKYNSRNFSEGQRVFDPSGISKTLNSNGGGLGAKTGLYTIPVLTPDRLEKRQNGRRFKTDGEPMFTLTGQDTHGVAISHGELKPKNISNNIDSNYHKGFDNHGQRVGVMDKVRIRRLTPTECERLQAFPDVEKRVIIQICSDPQKNSVNVEDKSLKSQKSVGNVEKTGLQQNAKYADLLFPQKGQSDRKHAQSDVLIGLEESGIEILNQGKLLLNAKGVEKKNWSHPLISLEDFAQIIAGINIILDRITIHGKEELHQSERCLIHQLNGKRLVRLSGKEITQLAEDVKKDSTILSKHLKSITLAPLNTKSFEQRLKILSSFVALAISGYIPKETQNQNTYMIEINHKHGWTEFGADGEKISDSQRYKMMGNALTCNVVTYIGHKLQEIYEESH